MSQAGQHSVLVLAHQHLLPAAQQHTGAAGAGVLAAAAAVARALRQDPAAGGSWGGAAPGAWPRAVGRAAAASRARARQVRQGRREAKVVERGARALADVQGGRVLRQGAQRAHRAGCQQRAAARLRGRLPVRLAERDDAPAPPRPALSVRHTPCCTLTGLARWRVRPHQTAARRTALSGSAREATMCGTAPEPITAMRPASSPARSRAALAEACAVDGSTYTDTAGCLYAITSLHSAKPRCDRA